MTQHSTEAEDDPLSRLKSQKIVTCRICKGDHWTTRCPYKDTLAPLQEALDGDKKPKEEPAAAPTSGLGKGPGKYVPPNMRDGGNKRGESMLANKRGMTILLVVWSKSFNRF